MSKPTPRLRMFAGPNGSGKSTLKSYLPAELLGVYLNPDEIEDNIGKHGFLDFSLYGLNVVPEQALSFFRSSEFLRNAGFCSSIESLTIVGGRLEFGNVPVNSYLASAVADFLRQNLLHQSISFTFETVMSHLSKIEILARAQAEGYRTYLYFVATEDPAINISRVRNRVNLGGHAVPEDKIIVRYYRSLDLLVDAIRHTNRAYIFDNSGDSKDGKQTWLAEITDGRHLELKTEIVPAWFKSSLLDKIR